ncbi:MAG: sigma-70 family RNA polymerase sigma factor [Pseudomonadota bacterium]
MSELEVPPTAEIYAKYRQRLLRLSEAIVGCPALAEDVVNEAFIALAKRSEQGNFEMSGAYLVQIVRNLSLKVKNKQRRELEVMTPYADYENLEQVEAQDVSPEQATVMLDQVRAFDEAVAQLPTLTRRAMRLYFSEKLTVRQTAERLNLSVGRVHRLLADGMEHCERRLRGASDGGQT